MDSINRFFLIAAGLIITAGLIFVSFRMADIGTVTANQIIEEYMGFEKNMENSEILKYDGMRVSGSDVINFLHKYLGQNSIGHDENMRITIVKDCVSISYQTREEIREIYNFSHVSYIDPTAFFQGSVSQNQNGVITEVCFVQQ